MKIIKRTVSKQNELTNIEKKVEKNSENITVLDKKITSINDTVANLIFGSDI